VNTQGSDGWNNLHPNPCIVNQVLLKEEEEGEEEEELGQSNIIPGSFRPTHRELLLAWTEVVSKNLDNFLMLLCVK